jgi:hypothetical protein
MQFKIRARVENIEGQISFAASQHTKGEDAIKFAAEKEMGHSLVKKFFKSYEWATIVLDTDLGTCIVEPNNGMSS